MVFKYSCLIPNIALTFLFVGFSTPLFAAPLNVSVVKRCRMQSAPRAEINSPFAWRDVNKTLKIGSKLFVVTSKQSPDEYLFKLPKQNATVYRASKSCFETVRGNPSSSPKSASSNSRNLVKYARATGIYWLETANLKVGTTTLEDEINVTHYGPMVGLGAEKAFSNQVSAGLQFAVLGTLSKATSKDNSAYAVTASSWQLGAGLTPGLYFNFSDSASLGLEIPFIVRKIFWASTTLGILESPLFTYGFEVPLRFKVGDNLRVGLRAGVSELSMKWRAGLDLDYLF